MSSRHGTVLEIQRMSTEDGPGIRTTVFMKGCPLDCAWCHNPESIAREPQVHWVGSRCIGCRICTATCTRKALSEICGAIAIDRELCTGCGECAEACPSTAMEQLGRRWGAAELAFEVLKDRAFFESSGGGVTLSGGEPTMQAAFSAEFLGRVMKAGVHTALDTCGLCKRDDLALLMPLADLVLFDLKLMNPVEHKRHTGSSNERILENLRFIGDTMRQTGKPGTLWIRTPIIPGATDDDFTIAAIGRFIGDHLNDVVS
ncbi:MAG: glycyl-radical enzyme activating protein, partial [Myxococcota bacterium]